MRNRTHLPLLALLTAALGSAGCTLHSGERFDRQYVRAVSGPVMACDNAERCARGMEMDIISDESIAKADRDAVSATVRALRDMMHSDPDALNCPAQHQLSSISFAEQLDARTDAALAQWDEINARYGRLNSIQKRAKLRDALTQ